MAGIKVKGTKTDYTNSKYEKEPNCYRGNNALVKLQSHFLLFPVVALLILGLSENVYAVGGVVSDESSCFAVGGFEFTSSYCNVQSLVVNSGETLTISSGIRLTSQTPVQNSGTIQNFGTYENVMGFTNSGIVDNSGLFQNSAGINNIGTFNNSGELVHDLQYAVFSNTGTFTNSGSVSLEGSTSGLVSLASIGYPVTTFYVGGNRVLEIDTASVLRIPIGYTLINNGVLQSNCGFLDNLGIYSGTPVSHFCDPDLDNISNAVDTQPGLFSVGFSHHSDTTGVTTSGTITTRGNQFLVILPYGEYRIRIIAPTFGGVLPASVSVCGGTILTLNAGDEAIATCGSVHVSGIAGQIEALFVDINNNSANAVLDEGDELIFHPETFTIESTGGTSEVTFTEAGGTVAVIDIAAGNTITFEADTFSFVADADNISDIPISINGETSTISAGNSFSINGETSTISADNSFSVITSNRDSFIMQGSSNSNEGANQILRIKSSDKNRPIVAFDQQQIQLATNGKNVISAKLRLYIVDNGNNWGSGNPLGSYRLLSDWVEGNGWNVGNNIAGTGSGVTWNCPADSKISNNKKNCDTKWDGGNFNPTPTNTLLITNNMNNQWIEFDVTADVQGFLDGSPNYGWLVKKTGDASLEGSVEFSSRESSVNRPELVLSLQSQ